MNIKKQQGISMLEILITIVVISFGFLSLASFQMGTLSYLSGSNQHLMATAMASTMGESIRANRTNALSYHEKSTKNFATNCGATGATCSIAEYDVWLWKTAFEQHAMQNVDGVVEIDGNDAIITISWLEKSSRGSDAVNQSYVLQVAF